SFQLRDGAFEGASRPRGVSGVEMVARRGDQAPWLVTTEADCEIEQFGGRGGRTAKPRGLRGGIKGVQRALVGPGCALGRVRRPRLGLLDAGAQPPVHPAPLGGRCASVDAVSEKGVAEVNPYTVDA